MIEDEKGLLPIVHFDATHGWATVQDFCNGDLTINGSERITSLLIQTIKAVAIEYHYIDKDYRDTFSGFHSKKFVTPPSRCIRLHFFLAPVSRQDIRDKTTIVQNAYVGYSVIRPTRPNCVGRTLLDPTKIHGLNGTMCCCSEKISLLGTELNIRGFPFISQDGDATVCAESATWMVLRYFSNRYPIYREVHPFQITNATQNYAFGLRVYPSGGLDLWQMCEALRREGFSPLIYSRNSAKFAAVFEELLYTYVESGFPVFAALDGHVVVAIGHRSNYAKALNAGQKCTNSNHFNDAFVINDDNCFPYQTVEFCPPNSPSKMASKYSVPDIKAFAVPLPERVFLSAEQFSSLVTALALSSKFSIAKHSPLLAQDQLITRQYLTTCRAFKKHLHNRGMGSGLVREVFHNLPLPHFIWICELSTPQEYMSAKPKIWGEIIWDATRNAHEHAGFIAVHYPENLWVDIGSALNRFQEFTHWPIKDSKPYPVLRSNLIEI